MAPWQRCTPASVAGHAMYERSNPYFEHFAGGMLDMSECHYEQWDEKTTRVTGPRFEPAPVMKVKLEGAGKVGERYMGIAGVRDPYTIDCIDEVMEWARQQVCDRFDTPEEGGYELHYQVYGRDAIMGEMEPHRDKPAHELGIVVFGVAPTEEMAEELTLTGTRQMFYARLPDVKGTAGGVSFPLDEVVKVTPAYSWTLTHTVEVADPMAIFDMYTTVLGIIV